MPVGRSEAMVLEREGGRGEGEKGEREEEREREANRRRQYCYNGQPLTYSILLYSAYRLMLCNTWIGLAVCCNTRPRWWSVLTLLLLILHVDMWQKHMAKHIYHHGSVDRRGVYSLVALYFGNTCKHLYATPYYTCVMHCGMQVLQYPRYCNHSGSLTPLPCRVVNHCLVAQVLVRTEG